MYGQQNYQHALKTVNNEVQLVSVGSFENLGSAKEYYETLLQHRGAVVQAPENKTEIFYLTNSNFDRLVNAETVREYRYRSEEHTSELQSLMRISYAVFCLKKKNI